jgi:hypothetical protein
MRKDGSRGLAHVSEIETVTDAPGVIAAAILGRVISWEVRSLSIGTSPWTRVLASRGDVCEDAHIATRLVAIGLNAVDFGSLGIARSICEVPHSGFMVRIGHETPWLCNAWGYSRCGILSNREGIYGR